MHILFVQAQGRFCRCCAGEGGFAEVPRIQNVGGFGEERMHLVQISCEAKVQGPIGSTHHLITRPLGGG